MTGILGPWLTSLLLVCDSVTFGEGQRRFLADG